MPLNIPLHLAEVDLYLRAKQLDSANALIDEALLINPGNYPLMMKKADIMIAINRPEVASQLLTEVTDAKPLNDAAWYQLAEARGLAGDIIGVHQAESRILLTQWGFRAGRETIVICTTACSSELSVE